MSLVGGKAQESNNEELLFQRLLAESLDVPPHLGHSDVGEGDRRGTPGPQGKLCSVKTGWISKVMSGGPQPKRCGVERTSSIPNRMSLPRSMLGDCTRCPRRFSSPGYSSRQAGRGVRIEGSVTISNENPLLSCAFPISAPLTETQGRSMVHE